jgi:hypothetical protein
MSAELCDLTHFCLRSTFRYPFQLHCGSQAFLLKFLPLFFSSISTMASGSIRKYAGNFTRLVMLNVENVLRYYISNREHISLCAT